jgi:hypothetical protein
MRRLKGDKRRADKHSRFRVPFGSIEEGMVYPNDLLLIKKVVS